MCVCDAVKLAAVTPCSRTGVGKLGRRGPYSIHPLLPRPRLSSFRTQCGPPVKKFPQPCSTKHNICGKVKVILEYVMALLSTEYQCKYSDATCSVKKCY